MENIIIPDEIPISLNSLKNYLKSNFQIEININEDFIKNIIGNNSYKLIKKGKNKNNVKINKKRKNKQDNIKDNDIIVNKIDYTNKNILENNKLNKIDKKLSKCNKCTENILKFAVERLINIKYYSDIKKIYYDFTNTEYNYSLIYRYFNNLMQSYINICNFTKSIKLQLNKIYEELCKYREQNANININIIEYEKILNKILKLIPTNKFIDNL